MRKQLLAIVGVVAGTGVALAAAYPEGPGAGGREARRPGPEEIKAELGLSDVQHAQLKQFRLQERKATIRRRADLQIARLELRELLDAANLDEKAVAVKVKEISELQSTALKARVDGRIALRKVLTPEQFDKLQDLRRRRIGRGPHKGGPHGRPGRRGPMDEGTELTEPEGR